MEGVVQHDRRRWIYWVAVHLHGREASGEDREQGEQEEVLTGHRHEGSPIILRTSWWLNLIALAAAVIPCLVLDLPWYTAGIAALITGTIADRAWAPRQRRRSRNA